VDARGIYRSLKEGGHTTLFGTSYMRHLMALCEEEGREAVIVTTHPGETYEAELGPFTILNRPMPGGRGLKYHYRQYRWMRDCLQELEHRGARTTILTAGAHYWFATGAVRRRGMRFVNSFHGSLRALNHSRLSVHEILIRATSRLHLAWGDPTQAVSLHILEQLRTEPGAARRQTWLFVPDYDRALFDDFEANPIGEGTVEILFAGRVEENKGVFDLLRACEMLNSAGERPYRFHIHGEGDALEALGKAAAVSPCKELFVIHGFTPGERLKEHYRDCHIVTVPTRSDLEEGLAKSVIEGVLALRPVVTSQACPAIRQVGPACLEAQVDNAESYASAFRRLAEERDLLSAKIEAARELRELFFDPPNHYGRAIRAAIAAAEAEQA
jgi:glycogen synthase